MILISISTYFEGKDLIKTLNLKKDTSITKYSVFKNENIILIITGTGKIKAAIALTYILTTYQNIKYFLNFGLCSSNDENINLGDTFVINKITDFDTKMTYYPDIIIKHDFKENEITTFSSIVCDNFSISNNSMDSKNNFNMSSANLTSKQRERHNNLSCQKTLLCDMESSALYEAALKFLKTDEICFIKTVSDHNLNDLNKSKVEIILKNLSPLMENLLHQIETFIKDDSKTISNNIPIKLKEITEISSNLKFSNTMENEFKNLIKYSSLISKDENAFISKMKHSTIKSKKEGKVILDEFRQDIIK